MSTTIATVADLMRQQRGDGEVTFTLTETATITRRVTMPLYEAHQLVESDGWADIEALTGDLDYGNLRDALSNAFDAGELVHDEDTTRNVDSITVD